MNMEPFRNGLVETSNRAVRTRRKPSTCPKCSEKMSRYTFWIFVLFYVIRRIIFTINIFIIIINIIIINIIIVIIIIIIIIIIVIIIFLLREIVWFFVYIGIFVSAWEQALWCLFWRIRLELFSVERLKKRSLWGKKGVYFPPESAFFVLTVNMIKVLFSICTWTWRVNNYVSRQEKDINRRSESTINNIMKYCTLLYNHFLVLFNLNNCCWLETHFC